MKEYWEGIHARCRNIDLRALVCEKLGYEAPLGYENWLSVTHFDKLEDPSLEDLWKAEHALVEKCADMDLEEIAERRLNAINNISKLYE